MTLEFKKNGDLLQNNLNRASLREAAPEGLKLDEDIIFLTFCKNRQIIGAV